MDNQIKVLQDINDQLKKFTETTEKLRRNQTLIYLSDKIKECLKIGFDDEAGSDWVICSIFNSFLKQIDDDGIKTEIQHYIICQGLNAFYKNHDLFNFVRDMEDARKKLEEGEEQ